MERLPVVLVFAGHDPSGGAGLIADSETIRALGGWAVTVPTALTVQDTRNVTAVTPCARGHIVAAAEALLADFEIKAVKIGLLADLDALEAVASVCAGLRDVPVVIDPVLKAGGGFELSSATLVAAFRHRLLPQATLLTPNLDELARLAPEGNDAAQRASQLIHMGCGAVLATGTDVADAAPQDDVVHTLFTRHGTTAWHWPRLPGAYHGSGCTLASACAVALAHGATLEDACATAQRFAWQSLVHAHRLGRGQALPARHGREGDAPHG